MNLNPQTQISLFEHKEIFNQLYKIIDSNLDIKKNEDLIINQIKKIIK